MRFRFLAVLAFLRVVAVAQPAFAQTWDFTPWYQTSPAGGWSFDGGDFNGDGRTDLVAYHPSDGSLSVGLNSGASFEFSQWATTSPLTGWSLAAGDFDGNGRSDVLLYHPSDGTLTIGINNGSSFSYSEWGHASPASGWVIEAGDFNGDGRADAALYRPGDGRVLIGLNSNGSFTFSKWADLLPASGWTLRAGRFNLQSGDDLLAYHPSDGSLWVLESTGTAFTFSSPWKTLQPAAGWLVDATNVCRSNSPTHCSFDRDELDDVVAYHPGDGTVWAGRNTGSKSFDFGSAPVFTTAPASGWTFVGGNFWRSDIGGVAFHYGGTGSIYVSGGGDVAVGYAWPLSAAPGSTIVFRVSGRAISTVQFLRHTAIADGVGPSAHAPVTSTLMGSTTFAPITQPTPAGNWFQTGPGWASSFSLVVPPAWPSGFYSARLTGPRGDSQDISFVVKPAPGARSRVALLANTNTWNAYNRSGGASRYDTLTNPGDLPIFSFLRPNHGAGNPLGVAPALADHTLRAELWVHSFLERNGYAPDVYTDADLHDGTFLADYDFLVLSTHPEYWTLEMIVNVQLFLSGGGSLLYLGGNGVFELASYVSGGTAMMYNGGDPNLPRANFFVRNLDPPRPERSLLGVATESCGWSPGTGYRVLVPSHPIFAGTSVQTGTIIGDYGLNISPTYNGKAAGHETDTATGPSAQAATVCGLAPPDAVPLPGSAPLPEGLEILARAGPDESPGAEITYYRHRGGGIVFSVGSINFGGSLAVEPTLQQMVRNAFALGQAPPPSVPSVGSIGSILLGALIGIALACSIAHRRRSV